jgi:hypothetical protein
MAEKELPSSLNRNPWESTSLALYHWDKMPRIFIIAFNIVLSGILGKQKSFSGELEKINKLFGTEFEMNGLENIPKTGGLVLVISHVVSTDEYPGWKNKDVSPIWWASGIVSAVSLVRSDEVRPVMFTYGGYNGPHGRIVQGAFGSFPVGHSTKYRKSNRESISKAGLAAKAGAIILVSPEGEARTALTEARKLAISRLISKGLIFVPVAYIEEQSGTEFVYKVKFGEQIVCDFSLPQPKRLSDPLPVNVNQRAQVDEFVDKLMIGIAKLLPEEKRGVYREKAGANQYS